MAGFGWNVIDALFGFLRHIGERGITINMPIEETGHWELTVKPGGFKPRWIVIHHSFSADGTTRNWDAIRKYHMSYRFNGDIITRERFEELLPQQVTGLEAPWTDVGYQFGVENVNGKIEVLQGRPIGAIGAHAMGFNAMSVGVCLVGNYDLDPPSADRLFVLASLCRQLQIEFEIPRYQVIGHRETYVKLNKPVEKTCPGSQFNLDAFRERLRA